MLSKYVYLSVQRVVRHPERTLTIMSASGLNRVLVAGPGVPTLPHSPASLEDLTAFALRWLASAS
jgi:hypothetical protein